MMNRFRSFTAAAALLLLPAAAVSAQATASSMFSKGSRLLSVGFVTGNDLGTGFGGQVEFGVYNFTNRLSLGVGAAVSYSSDSEFNVDVTYLPITAIGNVHLSIPEQPKLDLYGGLSLGIGTVNVDCDGIASAFCDDIGDSDTIFGAQIGARYGFTPRVSVMGQLGLSDIPLLTAGVSFKF